MPAKRQLLLYCLLPIVLAPLVACSSRLEKDIEGQSRKPRVVTVAQTGEADFVGSDNVVLQRAADSLQPGDTLQIGPGTYLMENSLLIPSGVTVRGKRGETILRKGKGVESLLTDDGDYGENQLRVAEPHKFRSGMGLSVSDNLLNSGWDVSVTTVKAVEGDVLRIEPMTLRDYNVEEQKARARNSFPILCAIETDGIVFEDLIVDGNKEENAYLDGCRGGAIYLYRSKNAIIRNCVARNYNGDGISFQITDNVQVLNCESHGHTGYGVHPGTGSPRAVVKDCHLHDNGQVGLFLCWRVRNGRFEGNLIERNGQYGVSIGHKDTDNVFLNNTIAQNGFCGVYFRKESFKNSGHRNRFERNRIQDNGNDREGYGVYIEPHAEGLEFSGNQISESRTGAARLQRYGIYRTAAAGALHLKDNQMSGHPQRDLFEENKRGQ
ncbi:MAG: right-handed parallel beta-helix repeat-containing protein [Acidobacteriota bacterium]